MKQLLGIPADTRLDLAQTALEFRGAMGWPGWLLGILILSAIAIALYRWSPAVITRTQKIILATLRCLFLGLLLFLLLRPVLAFTVEGSVRRLLVVLLDNSSSLKISDPRLTPDDQKRAAIARNLIAPDNGLKPSLSSGDIASVSRLSRLQLVQGVLDNPRLNLLPRIAKNFDVAVYQFDGAVNELASGTPSGSSTNSNSNNSQPANDAAPALSQSLNASGKSTALGDALREVVNRKRGQPLAGIWTITDGANNSGSSPADAAQRLRDENIPVYVYGVGLTSPRDIIVNSLFCPEVTFVDEELEITARIHGQGLAGETATVKLELGSQSVEQPITFTGTAEQVVTLRITPQSIGNFELTVSVPPRDDEAVKDNNIRKQRIKVVDARIHVLLVDGSPRWEFRYLQAMLLRDRRVNLKCFLVEGDPAIARTPNSPYLAAFPARREDLFKYDLVIFGDVDPRAVTPTQQEYVHELVSRFGGAFLMVAGKRYAPQGYRRSPLYNLLPVEFEGTTVDSALDTNPADRPIKLELTSNGRNSPLLRLDESDKRNRQIWEEMPPLYWVARVSRPKPAAEVLLVDPDPARESRFGKMPVVAIQQYGLGQSMFVGTDNTWRWRRNSGDAYYTAFWGQLIQRLALPRLLGGNRRTQLSTDRQSYVTGDRVTVFARLYSAAFEAVQEPVIKGQLTRKQDGARAGELVLRPMPDQAGLYRAEWIASESGDFQFQVETDTTANLEISVQEAQFELGDTAMNETLLKQIATVTRGGFFREEDLHQLPDLLNSKTEKVRSPLEIELWSSPLILILLVLLAGLEWGLRKFFFLK